MVTSERGVASLIVLLGTVPLLSLALLNGAPFFYFDSAAYIEQIAKLVGFSFAEPVVLHTVVEEGVGTGTEFGVADPDKVVYGGRSVYYGGLAWLGWVTSIWLPVLVQAAALSWLTVLLFRRYAVRWWWQSALLTLMALGLFSSAGLFIGLVMPDVWAGLMVLALAVYWGSYDRLSFGQKTLIFVIVSFSALAHNSHLVLLFVLVLCLGVGRLAIKRSRRRSLARFALPISAICIGVAGQILPSAAVRIAFDSDLLTRPHITAHLVDLGPGTDLIHDSCPENGFVLCAYADRLPVNWIEFLFGKNKETGVFAIAPPAQQKALVTEQMRFAVEVLTRYPRQTLTGLARDGIEQLWTLDIDDVMIGSRNSTFISRNFPSDLTSMIENSRAYDRPDFTQMLFRAIQTTSAIAAVLLLFYALLRSNRITRVPPELEKVILFMIAGFIINALICGVLASPYGRFQARIAWLLPLGVALILSNMAVGKRTVKHFEEAGTLA